MCVLRFYISMKTHGKKYLYKKLRKFHLSQEDLTAGQIGLRFYEYSIADWNCCQAHQS